MLCGAAPSYNMTMTQVRPSSNPHFAVAGVLVEALAAHDFDGLAAALEPDAEMSTLLPRGFVEWADCSSSAGGCASKASASATRR